MNHWPDLSLRGHPPDSGLVVESSLFRLGPWRGKSSWPPFTGWFLTWPFLQSPYLTSGHDRIQHLRPWTSPRYPPLSTPEFLTSPTVSFYTLCLHTPIFRPTWLWMGCRVVFISTGSLTRQIQLTSLPFPVWFLTWLFLQSPYLTSGHDRIKHLTIVLPSPYQLDDLTFWIISHNNK